MEHEGGCFLRAPCFSLTEAGTRTMHEAKLQRLPPDEVIEKPISISVPDTAAEFLQASCLKYIFRVLTNDLSHFSKTCFWNLVVGVPQMAKQLMLMD